LSNVAGDSNYVRVQVLTPVGVLDRDKQLGVVKELTDIVAAAAGDPKLTAYFDSERGRSYIRSTLRRSRVVEGLVDEWLAAHPEVTVVFVAQHRITISGASGSGAKAAIEVGYVTAWRDVLAHGGPPRPGLA